MVMVLSSRHLELSRHQGELSSRHKTLSSHDWMTTYKMYTVAFSNGDTLNGSHF